MCVCVCLCVCVCVCLRVCVCVLLLYLFSGAISPRAPAPAWHPWLHRVGALVLRLWHTQHQLPDRRLAAVLAAIAARAAAPAWLAHLHAALRRRTRAAQRGLARVEGSVWADSLLPL